MWKGVWILLFNAEVNVFGGVKASDCQLNEEQYLGRRWAKGYGGYLSRILGSMYRVEPEAQRTYQALTDGLFNISIMMRKQQREDRNLICTSSTSSHVPVNYPADSHIDLRQARKRSCHNYGTPLSDSDDQILIRTTRRRVRTLSRYLWNQGGCKPRQAGCTIYKDLVGPCRSCWAKAIMGHLSHLLQSMHDAQPPRFPQK